MMCSCIRTNNGMSGKVVTQQGVHQDSAIMDIKKISYEDIDVDEFIVYFEQFCKAILERDTITLSTMINDYIEGGWYLTENNLENMGKKSKRFFLDNLYVIFTPEFLKVLKSYDFEYHLKERQTNERWDASAPEKIYGSYVIFDNFELDLKKRKSYKVAFYKMYWSVDKKKHPESNVVDYRELEYSEYQQIIRKGDFERINFPTYSFMFVKSSEGIRLHGITLYYFGSIS